MPAISGTDQANSRRLSTIINDAARKHRDKRKSPQPWFMLKLTIAISAAIIAYSAYVYIGRLSIPMIRREDSALGSRTMGSQYPSLNMHAYRTDGEYMYHIKLCFWWCSSCLG